LTDTPILDFINDSSKTQVMEAVLAGVIRKRLLKEMDGEYSGVKSPEGRKVLDKLSRHVAREIIKKSKDVKTEAQFEIILKDVLERISKEST